jgi:molybdopterin biosynthesis enzyme
VSYPPSLSTCRADLDGTDLLAEGTEEIEIEVLVETPVGDNVRQPGSDAKEGTKVMDRGTVIGSGGGEVGLLGFVGKREVSRSIPGIYLDPIELMHSTWPVGQDH